MTFMCFFMIIMCVSLFPYFTQPFSLGLLLLFVSVFLSIMFSLVFSSWVGMLLFLIYVGGVLVMFVFVISFLPNISFPFMAFLVGSVFGSGISIISEPFSNSGGLTNSVFFLESVSISLYLGMVLVLFLILVTVVMLCLGQKKTLRGYIV